jgi:hypothetical protein
VLRNLCAVFHRNGDLLGTQAKVVLHPEDVGLVQAGSGWEVIATELGRLGLMVGTDVLYPEVGRLLAYRGAEILAVLAACADTTLFHKVRSGMLARMQDNQLFGVASFLVGPNEIGRTLRSEFVGRSAIFAPQELTPRKNGVLVEMGSLHAEGLLAAEWDFVALKQLWESSDTALRQQLPLEQAGKMLAELYTRLQSLPPVMEPNLLPEPDLATLPLQAEGMDSGMEAMRVRDLDELPVIGSVTSRWPLPGLAQDAPDVGLAAPREENVFAATPEGNLSDDDFAEDSFDESGEEDFTPNPAAAGLVADGDLRAEILAGQKRTGERPSGLAEGQEPPQSADDETDEMDALGEAGETAAAKTDDPPVARSEC